MAESPNNERLVYHNGSLVPEAQARLSIYDSAIATGEKVVEVSRTFAHKIYGLDTHLERLFSNLQLLRIDPGLSKREMEEATYETLQRNLTTQPKSVDWQVLHYISRGPAAHFGIVPEGQIYPTVLIQCIPLVNRLGKMAKRYTEGADLVVVDQRLVPSEVIPAQLKSSGRMDHIIGRLQANAIKPGSIGVLLGQDGYVAEGTGSSLFIVTSGKIQTAPSSRVLDGVTRGMIFSIAKDLEITIEEADFTPEEAARADEMFITSTVICQVHARSFNNQLVNGGRIGPLSKLVRKAFSEKVGLDFAQQALDYGKFLRENGPIT
ncbi:aminotransferase class IV [Candidatus Woesearchaeota archaeon]|nr:aminotransferase class IV [Candidatus Woesearchaeota archaeon]